ncbi:hypothetical protein [Sphingomonas sp.]|uniref:hypothetical protein n=1 Tax=Sphingomonas sp. TaxID=28214 RepID=UPI001B2E8A61|nr:hypothetical protein [Sphingomonas sp.]MBO9712832.1 hypothetical protein [Sphingomonas sp.]
MTAAISRPRGPTRLVARQVSELLLTRAGRWQPLVPHERIAAIVFASALGATLAHHPFRDAESGRWIGIEAANRLGRPVSGAAIAESMGLPHTNVRRRAAELVDAGLLIREAAGFRIAERFLADERFGPAAAEDVAALTHSLSALADAGYAPAARALDAGFSVLPDGVVGRLLVAFTLRALETFTELYGDVTSGTIVAAIVAANVRQVTGDPRLAERYAEEDMPLPDSLREPIGLRPLARAIDIPFETVRRRVNALVAEEVVAWKDAGVIVPTHVLLDERLLENNRRIMAHFEQLLNTLVTLAAEAHR